MLGARIAQLRKDQGRSQQALADELGIAQQTYAHYEVGRGRMPVSLLPEIAQIFGVTTDDLLGRKTAAAQATPCGRVHHPRFERLTQIDHS
ncbi:MAG TPA: helix-turn-helix transcriptional regulator [Steroidobacter sp.]|nr:helix-turn-helix transcriptional regulator [Steroidobacter sp.]